MFLNFQLSVFVGRDLVRFIESRTIVLLYLRLLRGGGTYVIRIQQ